MILNNTKDIVIGANKVSRIMLGSKSMWKRNNEKETLPLSEKYWRLFGSYDENIHEFTDDGIYLHTPNTVTYDRAYTYAETLKKFDLTNVDTIFAKVNSPTANSSQYERLSVSENTLANDPKDFTCVASTVIGKIGEGTVSLDVSDLSGEYYINFLCDYDSELYIYELLLVSKFNISDFDIVEYISTTYANQWTSLKTAVNPNDLEMKTKVAFNNVTSDEQQILTAGTVFSFSIHDSKMYIYSDDGSRLYSDSSLSSNTDYLLEYKMTDDIKTVTLDGASTSVAKSLLSTDSIVPNVFGSDLDRYSYLWRFNGKVYWLKIYSSGELVCDLVPVVRKYDGRVGLWDNILGNAFFSKSETEFLAPT